MGEFKGRQLQPVELAMRLHKVGFRDFDLVEMVATLLSESWGYTHAFNDNEADVGTPLKRGDKVRLPGTTGTALGQVLRSDRKRRRAFVRYPSQTDTWLRWDELRKVLSRDCGLGQINIPTRKIGTADEVRLYTVDTNLRAVKALFDARVTLTKRRRFNPWYGYTLGWATFPGWWVWTKREPRHWAPTGRYLHQALVGVTNFYAFKLGVVYPDPFVQLPEAPPKPTRPAAGGGVRPRENRGRGVLQA